MNDHQPPQDEHATPATPSVTPAPPTPVETPTDTTARPSASDASAAKMPNSATPASPEPPLATLSDENSFNRATATSAVRHATTAISDAGDARSSASDATATPAAVVDHRVYNLTIPQAQELFADSNRRVPAARTIQNYCAEGLVAGEKVSTASGAEWLINDESLLAFIQAKPELTASAGPSEAVAAPEAAPLPQAAGETPSERPHPPEAEAVSEAPVGETRTVAQMLIENARLSAELDVTRQVITGKDETIAELKSDREFLREEIKDKRRLNQDLKDITSQVLELLDNMVESRNPQLRMPETAEKETPPTAAPTWEAQVTEPGGTPAQRAPFGTN